MSAIVVAREWPDAGTGEQQVEYLDEGIEWPSDEILATEQIQLRWHPISPSPLVARAWYFEDLDSNGLPIDEPVAQTECGVWEWLDNCSVDNGAFTMEVPPQGRSSELLIIQAEWQVPEDVPSLVARASWAVPLTSDEDV